MNIKIYIDDDFRENYLKQAEINEILICKNCTFRVYPDEFKIFGSCRQCRSKKIRREIFLTKKKDGNTF